MHGDTLGNGEHKEELLSRDLDQFARTREASICAMAKRREMYEVRSFAELSFLRLQRFFTVRGSHSPGSLRLPVHGTAFTGP